MVEFYGNRINRGISKIQVLRQAKLTLANSEEFSDPRFWAPFVLYGLD